MSARQKSKGDDPLEPPRARTRTEGSAPVEPDQDREKPEQDQAAEQDQTAEDETKRKFREALAAKQGRRKGEDHIDNPQQHVHNQGPVETKRTFRRKTG